MDIVETLKQDYHRFPADQTYSLYAEDVYFKDPLNEFRGLGQYKRMIGFIETFFLETHMNLHDISRQQDQIKLRWTLHLKAPLPWKPHLAIPGRSELNLNAEELIISHIDYWNCSRLAVLKQALPFSQ